MKPESFNTWILSYQTTPRWHSISKVRYLLITTADTSADTAKGKGEAESDDDTLNDPDQDAIFPLSSYAPTKSSLPLRTSSLQNPTRAPRGYSGGANIRANVVVCFHRGSGEWV